MNRFIGPFARGVVSRTMGADSLEVRAMKPKMNKKLTLSRETVRELTDSQLSWAVGATGEDPCQLSQGGGGLCPSASRHTCLCLTGPGCNGGGC